MNLDENARRALGVLYQRAMDPLTAVRLARALELPVPTAQACLALLERSGLIERPTGSTYPFFSLTETGVGVFWLADGTEANEADETLVATIAGGPLLAHTA